MGKYWRHAEIFTWWSSGICAPKQLGCPWLRTGSTVPFFLLTPALGATGLLRVLTGPVTNPMTPGTDVGYPGAMIGSMIFVMTTCSRLITWVWRMACGLCLCGMWCWCGGAVRHIVSTIPEWRVDRSMSAHFAPSCPLECHGSCAHPPRDKCWHCAWARGDGRAWRPGLLRASLVW